MARVESLRAARQSPQVAFAEYLKVRSGDGLSPVLIFEGRQCPSFYVTKVMGLLGLTQVRQIIARGKRNVLSLREIIVNSSTCSNDFVLYFVDKDFDGSPLNGDIADVYVTRGYSFENELLPWSVIESLLRANFDICDATDQSALELIEAAYDLLMNKYYSLSAVAHKLIFVCRREGVRCIAVDSIHDSVSVDWSVLGVSVKVPSLDEIARMHQVDASALEGIKTKVCLASEFEGLDPAMDWRGKYHFSVVKDFLSLVASARLSGDRPFSRAAKINIDPNHPSLLSLICAAVPTPGCLIDFVHRNIARLPVT